MSSSKTLEIILRAKDLTSATLQKVETGMKNLNAVSQKYRSTLVSLNASSNNFRSTVAGLLVVIGGGRVASSFIESASGAEQAKIMLENLTGSVDEANKSFDWMLQTASKVPFSMNALQDSFVKLKSVGLDPLDGTLMTLVDSLAALGKGDEELKRVSAAIQQMAGKGVISMEELRQQLGEHLPTAMRAMSEGMGLSMAELSKAVSNGQVEATTGISAMLRVLKEQNEGSAADMMGGWVGLIAQLKTLWTEFALSMDDAGLFDTLKGNLSDLITKIKEMKESGEFDIWAERISTTVPRVLDAIIKFAGALVKVVGVLGPVLPALIQAVVYFKLFEVGIGLTIGPVLSLITQILALKGAFALVAPSLKAIAPILTVVLIPALKLLAVVAAALVSYKLGEWLDEWLYKISEIDLSGLNATKQLIKETADEQEYLNKRAEKYKDLFRELNVKDWAELHRAIKSGAISWDEVSAAKERVRQKTEGIASKEREAAQATQQTAVVAKQSTDEQIKALRQLYNTREKEIAVNDKIKDRDQAMMENKKALYREIINVVNQHSNEVIAASLKEKDTFIRSQEEILRDALRVFGERRQFILSSLDEAIAKERQYAQQVKGFADERATAERSVQDNLRGLIRTRMTEEEATADKIKEAEQKLGDARTAMYDGNLTLAKNLFKQSEGLYTELARSGKADYKDMFAGAEDAGLGYLASIAKQEKAATAKWKKQRESVDLLQDALKNVNESAIKLADSFELLMKEDRKQVLFEETGLGSIQKSYDKIEDKTTVVAFSDNGELEKIFEIYEKLEDKEITIKINQVVQQQGAGYNSGGLVHNVLKLATGGHLGGYGGGDRVPAMLEPGEYVIRKEAVKDIGVLFLNTLNALRTPDLLKGILNNLRVSLNDIRIPIRHDSTPIPRVLATSAPLKFATGGQVPAVGSGKNLSSALDGLQNFGTLNLRIDDGSPERVFSEKSLIGQLNKELKRRQLTVPNY